MKLFATIYKIKLQDSSLPHTEIWQKMVKDIIKKNKNSYKAISGRQFFAIDLSTCTRSENSSDLLNYKAISCEFLTDHQCSNFISFQGGNLFTDSSDYSRLSNNILYSRYSKYTQWIREISQISLTQHLSLIDEFVSNLNAAGWATELADPQDVQKKQFLFRNAKGSYLESFPKTKTLLRSPLIFPPEWELRIVCPEADFSNWRKAFVNVLQSLFPSGGTRLRNILPGAFGNLSTSNRVFGILVIGEDEDLEKGNFRNELLELELSGAKFRLVRKETLLNKWAIENIAFDLFLNAGGVPWIVENLRFDESQYIALDAGHQVAKKKSRWASVRYDASNNDVRGYWQDKVLGEHLDIDLYNKLISLIDGERKVTIYRDGRFLRERSLVEGMNKKQNSSIYEVSKYPKVILYRGDSENCKPTFFGDVYQLPGGDSLVQTQSPNVNEYRGPLKVVRIGEMGLDLESVDEFLGLCVMPMLSLNNRPRLPAPIYWADLISKLDTTKWAKAVGRGFKLPAPDVDPIDL